MVLNAEGGLKKVEASELDVVELCQVLDAQELQVGALHAQHRLRTGMVGLGGDRGRGGATMAADGSRLRCELGRHALLNKYESSIPPPQYLAVEKMVIIEKL